MLKPKRPNIWLPVSGRILFSGSLLGQQDRDIFIALNILPNRFPKQPVPAFIFGSLWAGRGAGDQALDLFPCEEWERWAREKTGVPSLAWKKPDKVSQWR